MDARAAKISNNNALIPIPYAPPDQPHDDELVCDHGVRCIIRVHAYLLPMVYCACQLPRTRGRRRKANIRTAFEAVQAVFEQHPITQRLAPHVLAEWQAWATDRVKVFQRASSAVGGPQRHTIATASQSARLTTTAVQGVDGSAQLRLSRGGWYDTSRALFPATVPGPLRNSVIAYRGPASTTEAKTSSCSRSLKSLGVPPYTDTRFGVST